jgi:hypothetical protein
VLVADTRNVGAMTHAKVKNDRVDARMIAKLLAAGMLPGVWICDEAMRVLRRQLARRTQLVRGPARRIRPSDADSQPRRSRPELRRVLLADDRVGVPGSG